MHTTAERRPSNDSGEKQELEARCLRFRRELIQLLHRIQTGHPGGPLSCTEILTTLYGVIMNYDAKDPKKRAGTG